MQAHAFHGRHILVTGAGTGIGRAIAERLAAEGALVTLCGRDAARLDLVARAIRAAGGHAAAQPADVRRLDSVERACDAACALFGALHAGVANAGVGGPNAAGPQDRFDDLVATNLAGTYHTFRAVERRLAPGPGPRHLLAVSSILARIGVGGYSGYCASKAGILGLVRALAAELAPMDVQVNAVCPGWVDTDMAREGLEGMARGMGVSFDEARRIALSAVPLGRMGTPAEVAGVVRWLLSDDARGVTGQGVDANNGAYMA
ncbi:MAG: SDR family NAD(P)-dependent oxidoreductase [Planctomycetia bacterium]|jgi:NAD(P)-dependent dehydrogenase (short-subunit alcohol dehydrogenase family)